MNENFAQNGGSAYTPEIEALQATFAQIKQAQTNGFSNLPQDGENKPKIKREDLMKKYFTPQNEKEIFRVLPPKKGEKHIEEAYFHVVSVNTPKGKQTKKIYCPAHNNPKVPKTDPSGNILLDAVGNPIMVDDYCPLCNKFHEINAKKTPLYVKKENYTEEQKVIAEANKKIFAEASNWEAKKFYIIKGIDKGQAKDGPKFWRFKHNYKKQGVLDKLSPVLFEFFEVYKKDFSDPMFGCDLSITTAKQIHPMTGKPYIDVTAINARQQCKLTEDVQIADEWLKDELTWRDVFKMPSAPNITPYQYLEMVLEGTQPYYDDTDASNKHWVFPGRPELQAQANTRTRDLGVNSDGTSSQNYMQNATMNSVANQQVQPNPVQGVNLTQQINNFAAQQQTPSQQTFGYQPPVQQTQYQQPVQQTQQVIGNVDEVDDDLPF